MDSETRAEIARILRESAERVEGSERASAREEANSAPPILRAGCAPTTRLSTTAAKMARRSPHGGYLFPLVMATFALLDSALVAWILLLFIR